MADEEEGMRMVVISKRIRNLKETILKLRKMEQRGATEGRKEPEDWTYEWAQKVVRNSQHMIRFGYQPDPPYDTGTMYRSGRVLQRRAKRPKMSITVKPRNIRYTVAFGGIGVNPKTGRTVDYSYVVHEGLGMNWRKGPRPFLNDGLEMSWADLDDKQKKYLEEVVKNFSRDQAPMG